MLEPNPAATVPPALAAPAGAPPLPGTPAPAGTGAPTPGAKPSGTPAPAGTGAPQTPQTPQTVPLPELLQEREKRQALEKAMTDMQTELANLKGQANLPQAGQQPQPQQYDFAQAIEKAWEEEPKRAVQMEISAALNWYDSINMAVQRQEDEIAGKNPDFNNYRSQVRQYIQNIPIQQRAQPGVVALAYYAVRGQNVDSLIEKMKKDYEAEVIRKYQAGELGGLPPGSVSTPPPVAGQVQLTNDEKVAAAAMGIPEAEYAKYKVSK